MSRPEMTPINNGAQGWDALVNDNLSQLYEGPLPLMVHTGDETDLEATFPAAQYEDCLIWVDHTALGKTLYRSTGSVWAVFAASGGSKDVSSFRHAGGSGLEAWYIANCSNASSLTLTGAGASQLWALPFVSPQRGGVLDRLGFSVINPTGGTNGRIGLYSNTSDSNIYPAALLEDSGDLSTATSGSKTYTINRELLPGRIYWVAYVASSASPGLMAINASGISGILGVNAALTSPNTSIRVAHTFGALPDPYPGGGALLNLTTGVPIPMLCVRFSS